MRIAPRFGVFVALFIASYVAASCGVLSAPNSADDAKKWQGTWKMVSCEYDGEPQTADMAWVVSGDHYNIRMNGQVNSDPYFFKLDASRKVVDIFHHDTPRGTIGGKLKGIYEINGDSLIVCYDLTEQNYPTSFEAPRGSRRVLYHFKRE
jgi:uncharacterized protein (TIGR03067 family)